MTQYLGIITAYSAVAILAWLAALLYPRLIPASAPYVVDRRWRQAGFFLAALVASLALAALIRRDMLLPGDGLAAELLNLLVVTTPVLVYVAAQRSGAAILVPRTNHLRSLSIGVIAASLALAAYFSATGRWAEILTLGQSVSWDDAHTITLRTLQRCLIAAAFLALVAGGWSIRVALGIATVATAAVHVPSLLSDGYTAGWLAMLVMHVALVAGLLSAIHVTRNIVWFWPVFLTLNLLQFATA